MWKLGRGKHNRSPEAEQDRYQRHLLKKAQREFKHKWISNHTYVDFERAETVSKTTDKELCYALRDAFPGEPNLISHLIPEIVRGEIFSDSRGRGSHQRGF